MIDTLKLSKGLQKAGMSEEQANGITEALRDAQADYVTRADLDAAVSRLETRISDKAFQVVLWIIGSIVLQIVGHFWH
jgi:hypothetical protein